MKIDVKLFGQLADIIGSDLIQIDDVEDTNALVKNLQSKYPLLANSKYRIAVNKNIIQTNTVLQSSTEIALLPPFSGG